MDNKTPAFEIPGQPAVEMQPLHVGPEQAPEMGEAVPIETLPSPVAHVAPMHPVGPTGTNGQAVSAMTNPLLATAQMQAPQQGLAADAHLIADDVDVMEKDWVERTRKVLKATAHDPFLQAQEISKLKAMYMKKRFNKDISIDTRGAA